VSDEYRSPPRVTSACDDASRCLRTSIAKRLVAGAALSVLVLICLISTASADTGCFCLKHEASENKRFGCHWVRKGAAGRDVQCRLDQSASATTSLVTVDPKGWTEIPEGKPGCEQCAPSLRNLGNAIRGNEVVVKEPSDGKR